MNPLQTTNYKLPTNKGYTLIELLLYISLVSVLLFSLSYFWANTVTARIKNQTILEVEEVGTEAMNNITQSIRNADSITAPTAGVSGQSLTLANSNVAINPTVFDLASGTLRIKEGSNAVVNITSDKLTISNLSFANLSNTASPGIIRVTFTVTYKNTTGRNEYDFSKTFYDSAAIRKK